MKCTKVALTRSGKDHSSPLRVEMAGQDRWERAVLSGQSAIATALICIVVLVTLPLLKMLVRLGALVGLASLYINNPCREPSTHNKAWEMLLAERSRRIGERNAKDVSNLNVLSLIKNAVNDTTGLISGQRVMCDFVFFSFALYFALGIAYKVKRFGAKGLDAIPHLEMWLDLPYLVRDGVIFSIDTLKSKGRPNYEAVL